jgi:hypothetical protein
MVPLSFVLLAAHQYRVLKLLLSDGVMLIDVQFSEGLILFFLRPGLQNNPPEECH